MNEIPDNSAASSRQQTPDAFESSLQATLHGVNAPAGLLERLLGIPDLVGDADTAATASPATATASGASAANEPQWWRRLLPAAAALFIAVGIGLYHEPDLNAALANEIFGHIYIEEPYYGDGTALPLAELNARIQQVTGAPLDPEDAATLEVSFAKDCYVAKQRTMHLVVKGSTGPVNVMMIPEQVVDDEVRIADRRFSGLVTPASGGTLVVVGNKQEPLARTRDLVANSLHWDY